MSDSGVRIPEGLYQFGHLHNISVSQFPYLEKKDYNNIYLKCCYNTLAFAKYLDKHLACRKYSEIGFID